MNEWFDLNLEEVSVVGAGDNPEARIVLMKSLEKGSTKHEMGQDFPSEAFAYVPDASKPSTWKLRLWDSLEEKVTSRQVGRAVAALGEGFRGQKVEIPAKDLPKVKSKVLAAWRQVHEKGAEVPSVLKEKTVNEEDVKKLEQERDAAMALAKDMEDKFNALSKEFGEFKKTKEESTEDSIEKADIPEAVKKALDEQMETISKQAAAIEKMEDEKLTAVWFGKAKEVVGVNDEVADMLKSIAKLNGALADRVYAVLKAATEQVEKGDLFKEFGKSGDGDGETAYDKLKKIADKIREANPSLSAEQAFSKAYKENAKLRTEYRKELK